MSGFAARLAISGWCGKGVMKLSKDCQRLIDREAPFGMLVRGNPAKPCGEVARCPLGLPMLPRIAWNRRPLVDRNVSLPLFGPSATLATARTWTQNRRVAIKIMPATRSDF